MSDGFFLAELAVQSVHIGDIRPHLDFFLVSLYFATTYASEKVAGEMTAGAGEFDTMSDWAGKTD